MKLLDFFRRHHRTRKPATAGAPATTTRRGTLPRSELRRKHVPPRAEAPKTSVSVEVELDLPEEPGRPILLALVEGDGGTGEDLYWAMRDVLRVASYHDAYRFLCAVRTCLDRGCDVAAIVVDQIVPKFLFLTLLAHLDSEERLQGVPVIYLRGAGQLAVFVDGELRMTRPLTEATRSAVVTETVSALVARRLEQLSSPGDAETVRAVGGRLVQGTAAVN